MVIKLSKPEDVLGYLNENKLEVNLAALDAMKAGIKKKVKTVILFECIFDEEDYAFEIKLPKENWAACLEDLKEYFREEEYNDEAIDCYELLKKLKNSGKNK